MSRHPLLEEDDERECPDCEGEGRVYPDGGGAFSDGVVCSDCKGTGRLPANPDAELVICVWYNDGASNSREAGHYWRDDRNDQDLAHGPFHEANKAVGFARKALA